MVTVERAKRQGIQLCYPFEEKRLAKWSPPYFVQPKLDGERCRAVWQDGWNGYQLLSSTEHIITSVPHINKALNESGLRAELDGELYRHGLTFEQIYSRVSRTVNQHEDSRAIQFHIFDIVADAPQVERTTWLLSNIKVNDTLKLVNTRVCDDLDAVTTCYDQLLNKGYEGMIVRNMDASYVRKRSTFMMKFKPKKNDWYKVVGVQEEIDKNGVPKGTLGAIICAGDDGTRFGVGSGLTRDQRHDFWERKHLLLGGICHVAYQHITPGKNVPRFPVFISVDEREEDEQIRIS